MDNSKVKVAPSKSVAVILEKIFWVCCLLVLVVGEFCADTKVKKSLVTASAIVCLVIPAMKLMFKKNDFISSLSTHLESCVCLTAALGAGVGFGFGVFRLFPEYGIILHFIGGIIGVAIGYYVGIALKKPQSAKDFNYITFMSFCISCAFLVPRKILQFFIDYFTGRDLIKCDFVGDDHWLFSVVGHMGSLYEQRPLYDYSEDLLFGIAGAVIATGVLYLYLRLHNKPAFKKEKKSTKLSFKAIPSRLVDKLFYEIEKVRQQTNIFDMIIWWCTRALMLYAFITMESRAEATLLFAIFVGTFAISILHYITPKGSMFCRIDYKVQTLITIIAFFGSYVGNYINIYSIIGRYDAFLHFISGFISFTAGYYLALTLVEPKTKKDKFSIYLFALAFAIAIIPIHETVEFVGDYIWGTTNQGFMWEPDDDILLYNLFGHGVGNELLIRIYDTIYDMSLASFTSTMSFIVMCISLVVTRKDKNAINVDCSREKEKISC